MVFILLKVKLQLLSYPLLMVGPVLKIKTGFRGFEPNEIWDFESVQKYGKNFTRVYMSCIVQRKYAFPR